MPAHRRCDIKAFSILSVCAVLAFPLVQAASAATTELRERGDRAVRILDRATDTIQRAKEASGDEARVDALVDRARDYVDRTETPGDGGNRVDRLLDRAERLLEQTESDPSAATRALTVEPPPSDR